MKILTKFLFIFIVLTWTSCFPDNTEPETIEGVYIGKTYELHQFSSTLSGYQSHDTIYDDTMELMLIGNDSVLITYKNFEWEFKPDSNYHYTRYYSSHVLDQFIIIPYDTLIVEQYYWSGYSSNFSQSDITFTGIKQK